MSAIAVVLLAVGVSVAHDRRARGAPALSVSQLSTVAISPTATTAAPSAPALVPASEPCSAADLHVAPGFGGAATNNISQPFVLTNGGSGDCFLQGYPRLLQGWQGGGWHQLTFTEGTFFIDEDPSPAPVDLPPGGQAELIVGTGDACNGGDIGDSKLYSRLQATLPAGTTIELNAPANAFCGLDVSSFHPMPVPVSSDLLPDPPRLP